MDPVDFASQYLGQQKDLGSEINAKHCPFCGPNNKSDNQYKFYMNKDTGAYQCKRANSCGAKGSFYELAEHFGVEGEAETGDYKPVKKQYKKPDIETEKVKNEKIKKYVKARGFHEEIIDQLPIKQYKHPAYGWVIAFMYYRQKGDEKPTFIKYRNFKKKGDNRLYRREKDTKPILWNMDKLNPKEPILICEGEWDAVAAIQSGFKNATSIPSGASDLTWIDNCKDFLEEAKEFILWGDNDEAGHKLEKDLAAELGEFNCKIVEPLEGYNDVNEIMYKEGEGKVLDMILNAKSMPVDDIIDLADIDLSGDDSDEETVSSGFPKLDRTINGFGMGKVSIWTGESGSGKSTLLGQTLIEAMERGYKVCAFSGELPKKKYKRWTQRQMVTDKYISNRKNKYDMVEYKVLNHISEHLNDYYNNTYYLFDADRTRVDADRILNRFEQMAERRGIKVFLIDNMIKMNLDKNNFYASQSEFIDKCSVFAHKHDCHLHIVAHPRKTNDKINKMDISGSGDITNLADNVFAVANYSKDPEKPYDGEIAVLKDRWHGNAGVKVKLTFNKQNLRFAEVEEPFQIRRKLKWEKEFEKEE